MSLLTDIIDNFYCKKITIDILEQVDHFKAVNSNTDSKPKIKTIKQALKGSYTENDLNETLKFLIYNRYLEKQAVTSHILLTLEGKVFLRDYYRYKMCSSFARFTEVFKKNLSVIFSTLSFVLSILALIIAMTYPQIVHVSKLI